MQLSKAEEITGKLEAITSLKETKKAKRKYFGAKVNGIWYNKFGSEEDLNRIVANLERDSDVKVQFRTRVVNDQAFREISSISPVIQGVLETPSTIFEFTILENGKLNLTKLKDALECWKSDIEWCLEELEKVKE